ncbi:MAG: hypothetical protein BKP49_04055 [Treponema sp. CETP13]|nr:MAG: hypothetical protein BKP49_04055 [Treponema sp. CETP13]
MIKQELVDRSPVRFLEKVTEGGLKAGELGVLSSKKGLGKTSVLVQLGLDKLLQGKHVVHVSFNQQSNYVMTWYEDIFSEMSKNKKTTDVEKIKEEVMHNRVILNLSQTVEVTPQIIDTLKALSANHISIACVIIDGIDLPKVPVDNLVKMKAFAKEAGLSVWYSCNTEETQLSKVLGKDECAQIDAVVHLKQVPGCIDMQIVKFHDRTDFNTDLKLDTKTLLISEK